MKVLFLFASLAYVACFIELSFAGHELINLKSEYETVIPVHGKPFKIKKARLESDLLFYLNEKGEETFISLSNVRNRAEIEFMVKAAIHNLDNDTLNKSREHGKAIDELSVEIDRVQKEGAETIDKLRAKKTPTRHN